MAIDVRGGGRVGREGEHQCQMLPRSAGLRRAHRPGAKEVTGDSGKVSSRGKVNMAEEVCLRKFHTFRKF